jgi:hypothetical protein
MPYTICHMPYAIEFSVMVTAQFMYVGYLILRNEYLLRVFVMRYVQGKFVHSSAC